MRLRSCLYAMSVVSAVIGGEAQAGSLARGVSKCLAGEAQSALNEWLPLAKRGEARAQFAIALTYDGQNCGGGSLANGARITADHDKALYWYRRAAGRNFAPAQVNLGIALSQKSSYGEALLWFSRAAHQGDALGEKYLGDMYENGYGVRQNSSTAKYWHSKSTEHANFHAANSKAETYGAKLSTSEGGYNIYALKASRNYIVSTATAVPTEQPQLPYYERIMILPN